jgi:hypothetical protein
MSECDIAQNWIVSQKVFCSFATQHAVVLQESEWNFVKLWSGTRRIVQVHGKRCRLGCAHVQEEFTPFFRSFILILWSLYSRICFPNRQHSSKYHNRVYLIWALFEENWQLSVWAEGAVLSVSQYLVNFWTTCKREQFFQKEATDWCEWQRFAVTFAIWAPSHKSRKASGNFVMSVFPPACICSAPTGRMCVKFNIGNF